MWVAAVNHRPLPDYRPRLLTAADLAVLPSEMPSGTVRHELDNGILMTLPVHDCFHAAAVSNLGAAFHIQADIPGHGKTYSGVGVILWRNPDRVIGVDLAFFAQASLPLRLSPEDYVETMPDLVVEIRDRIDTDALVSRRVNDLLTAGVRVVWSAEPEVGKVTEFRPNQPDRAYLEDDTLTLDDVIPGFSLLVRDALQT